MLRLIGARVPYISRTLVPDMLGDAASFASPSTGVAQLSRNTELLLSYSTILSHFIPKMLYPGLIEVAS